MSRQEGGWCVRRCVFLLKRMTRRLRRESGAYHFNGPLVNLLRQATQRGAGDEWKATCLCRCTPTLPEGNPLRMHDAPTTARTVGLPPRGGKYFLSKRKKVPKKARGTATTGKRLLLPILTAGLATSRAMELASYLLRSCALLCSPFSAVKMGGPFSLRCLSPLCSPAGGAGQTQMAALGMLRCG